jgi:hypothetical protein
MDAMNNMKDISGDTVDLTSSADAGPQVVVELKGILDSDAGRIPHFLELTGRAHS